MLTADQLVDLWTLKKSPPSTVHLPDDFDWRGGVRLAGLSKGQTDDVRFLLRDGRSLHLQRYEEGWKGHVDTAHPTSPVGLVQHLHHDTWVTPAAIVGLLIGLAVGRKLPLLGVALALLITMAGATKSRGCEIS